MARRVDGDTLAWVNVLLTSIGTAGDIQPFIGLGIALRERGHRVTMLVNEHFEAWATENNLEFVPLGTEEEYRRALLESQQHHSLRKRMDGLRTLVRAICETMPVQYDRIAERYEPGRTVVAASGAAFGARIAQEKLGIPLATIVLQPAVLRSAYIMPKVAGTPHLPGWLPPFGKRFFFRFADIILDSVFHASEVNAFRARLGLKPVHRLMKDWWLSPQRVIALFPDWFCNPQPDWPAALRMTGFPLYDGRTDGTALPGEVASFLEEGSPPIVFTPGSGMMQAHAFFQASAEACRLLGARGIFLTRYVDQLPGRLPNSIRHSEYVPLSRLLPRTAALVHHGGIGTLSQALAAGVPQLIMPMAYDQPDNAARIRSLGVGDWLKPVAYCPQSVATKLEQLIHSSDVASRCQAVAKQMDGIDALRRTCELIEDLADGNDSPAYRRAGAGSRTVGDAVQAMV